MTHLFKALITGSALIALSGAAAAEDMFRAAFTYDKAATAETIYASLSDQAKNACVAQKRRMAQKGQTLSGRFVYDCHRDLMDQAVSATEITSLISLHAERTGKNPLARRFAGGE